MTIAPPSVHPLADLSVLDQFAAKPFAPGYPSDHRTLNAPVDNLCGAALAVVESVALSQTLAMYSFDHPELVAAYTENVRNGIPSLTVLDSSEFTDEEREKLAPLLAVFGPAYPHHRLSIGTAEDGHDIMHRKTYIGDGSLVISGSFNWTESACREDNQMTVGIWPSDAALLTASIEATYAWQLQHQPQYQPQAS